MKRPNGRPSYTEAKFQEWLEEMKPFLKLGHTIRQSIIKAGLMRHHAVIYDKARLRDWFSEKVEVYRRYPLELKLVKKISHLKKEYGYVYLFVSDRDMNIYKIGCADNIDIRLKGLNQVYYFNLSFVDKMLSAKKEIHESILHEHFKAKRLKGEWYILDENDLIYIKDYFIKNNGK